MVKEYITNLVKGLVAFVMTLFGVKLQHVQPKYPTYKGVAYKTVGNIDVAVIDMSVFDGGKVPDLQSNNDNMPWMTVYIGETCQYSMMFEPATGKLHVYYVEKPTSSTELYAKLCVSPAPLRLLIEQFPNQPVKADIIAPVPIDYPLAEMALINALAEPKEMQLTTAKKLFEKYTGFKV